MRPLYIQGAASQVRRDGASLRVARSGVAECWFPLQRISRVVSAVQVEWSTEALLACAEHGVTVSFLDGTGVVLARLVGRPGERGELRQHLADFLLRSDGPALYADWRAAMEQMAMRSVLRRSGLPLARPPSAGAFRQAFREAARSMNAAVAFERIEREVCGLLTALGTQLLQDAGIGGELADGPAFKLADDFAAILFWDFQLARSAWLEERLASGGVGTPGRGEIVAFFEARRPRVERLAQGLINRLHRWLIEAG
jgi:hypothetical protein